MKLNTEPNFVNADDFYERLLETHRNLSAEQSGTVNARLILLLANHIGDMQVLNEAMMIARGAINDGSNG